MKNLKKNVNGITLIALIITIIVLLILAGISISMVAGDNGVLTKAKDSSDKTLDAKEDEQVKLSISDALADGNGTLSTESIRSALEKEFGADKVTDATFTGNGPWTYNGERKTYYIDSEGRVSEKNIADRTGLKVGDYINYQPDKKTENYSKITPQNTGYTSGENGTQEQIKQEELNWRIFRINKNGSIDIIGSQTEKEVFFQGSLGYNNGVFLLNDLCETLYSKESAGIKARSVKLDDLEEFLTDTGKGVVSSYTNDNGVKYNETHNYPYDSGKKYYPDLYQYEIYSGVTGTIKEDGIKKSEIYSGYTGGLTSNKTKEAGQNGLTLKQTFYMMDINKDNFGDVSDVFSGSYWMSTRVVNCILSDDGDKGGRFAISCSNNSKIDGVALIYSRYKDGEGLWHFPIRPVVTLSSNVEIQKCTGENKVDNQHNIIKY